jgi:glycopeptide antibiotics resistance protein
MLIWASPIPLTIAAFRLRAGMKWWVAALWAGLGVYALWAADLLFFPMLVESAARADSHYVADSLGHWINVVPFRTIRDLLARSSPTQAVRQIGGNVGLLLPMGLFMPVLTNRFRRLLALTLLALVTSIGIEAIQCVGIVTGFLIARSVDIDDVILNVFGALLGWGIWKVLVAVLAHRRRSRGVEAAGEPSS